MEQVFQSSRNRKKGKERQICEETAKFKRNTGNR